MSARAFGEYSDTSIGATFINTISAELNGLGIKAETMIYKSMTNCGECPFFKYEDTDGYGICDIIGNESNCSLVCAFDKQGELTKRQAVKVLHHAQKWRRGAKIGMPPPVLLGLAIDTGIRVLRQKIKEEK